MHFWIDKRSQTCGFGRARVAASLGGGSVGLGFGTPPRRMISKPSAAIIHRQQQHHSTNADSSSRPHNTSNNNNSSHNNSSNSNNNNHGTPIVTNSSNTNNNNPNTRNNRSRSNHSNGSSPYQLHRQQQQSHHHNYDGGHQATRHYNGQQQHLQQPVQQHQHQYQRHHVNPMDHHSPHNLPRATTQLLTVNNQDYHIPVTLPYNYGGPSHTIDLEQGSMGIESLSVRNATMAANHQIGPSPSHGHHVLAEVSGDAQLLPAHLKFGMCASLVLASVFIAGAKYYFDHQGGGMDALIFCAFLTISFLALCAISLCRYVPRDLTASPSISVDGRSRMLDMQHRGPDHGNGSGQHNSGSPHPQIYAQNVDQNGQDMLITHSPVTSSIAAPPPPYHIAILLPPENGKEMQLDESPPPSYDKILI